MSSILTRQSTTLHAFLVSGCYSVDSVVVDMWCYVSLTSSISGTTWGWFISQHFLSDTIIKNTVTVTHWKLAIIFF